jgi:hypothetical protein
MGKARRPEAPNGRRAKAGCGVLLLVGALAGCADLNKNTTPNTTNDPLLGTPAKPPVKTTDAGTIGPPPVATLPPLPSTVPSTSPAALAGLQRPADGGDLRIASPRPANEGWGVQPAAAPPSKSGASLSPPQVSVDSPPQGTTPPPLPPPGVTGAAAIAGYDQAQAELKARGVLWQRLEVVGDTGAWKFTCSVPNPQTPRLRRTYEVTAKDYLSAIHAAIDQIDHDK